MKGAGGIFAGRHGFAFPVFMVSFVAEIASVIDFYLLRLSAKTFLMCGDEEMKKYAMPVIMLAVFETVAITLWLTGIHHRKGCVL